VSPDLCWWLHDPWNSLAPNDLLSVVTSRGQAPAPAGALGACEARGGPPLLLIGSRCEPVPRNAWATPAQNRSPSPRDRGALWDGRAGHLHLKPSARWELSRLQAAPEGDQELPRERHNPDLPAARPALAQPGLLPLRERALGLTAHPAPGTREGQGPPIALPGLRHPEFPGSLSTLLGWRRQARSRSPRLWRRHSAPREQCPHQEPGTLDPKPAERGHLAALLQPPLFTGAPRRSPLGLQAPDVLREPLDLLPLPLQASAPSRGQRRPVPLADLFALGLPIAWPRHASGAAGSGSAADAVGSRLYTETV
jgi:hypothetical protein